METYRVTEHSFTVTGVTATRNVPGDAYLSLPEELRFPVKIRLTWLKLFDGEYKLMNQEYRSRRGNYHWFCVASVRPDEKVTDENIEEAARKFALKFSNLVWMNGHPFELALPYPQEKLIEWCNAHLRDFRPKVWRRSNAKKPTT